MRTDSLGQYGLHPQTRYLLLRCHDTVTASYVHVTYHLPFDVLMSSLIYLPFSVLPSIAPRSPASVHCTPHEANSPPPIPISACPSRSSKIENLLNFLPPPRRPIDTRPFRTHRSRVQTLLIPIRHGPPLARLVVLAHKRHVRIKVLPGVLEAREQDRCRRVVGDGVWHHDNHDQPL